jgi:hypothetical protein
VVLSADEVVRFLEAIPSLKSRTALTTVYAVGLRVSEVVLLKITDIDSQRMVIRVEQGNAASISPSVAGCSMPITSRSIPSWRTLTPKAIDRATPVTSSSAPIAAAPCGASQPFRAHPHISHSTVIRHDLIAADFRHHRRRACCASCRQSASYADRLPQYRLQSWPTTEPDLLLAFSTQSARSSSPKRRFASIARPSSEQSRQHAVATFPIAPKQPAASFNPASMRSCSRSRPRRRCANDLTEPSRFPY